MTLTTAQLQVLFLQAAGCWTIRPLSTVSGVYLGHEVSVSPRRWTVLHADAVTIQMAARAKQALVTG